MHIRFRNMSTFLVATSLVVVGALGLLELIDFSLPIVGLLLAMAAYLVALLLFGY